MLYSKRGNHVTGSPPITRLTREAHENIHRETTDTIKNNKNPSDDYSFFFLLFFGKL
jgi:hypothetical protein